MGIVLILAGGRAHRDDAVRSRGPALLAIIQASRHGLPMSHPLLSLRDGPVCRLRMNRPELHNAFDAVLIAALTGALEAASRDDTARVVILEAEGPSFSAGADLNWMRGMASASEEANREDALALARLMRTLDELPKPTIARVHGPALGGG